MSAKRAKMILVLKNLIIAEALVYLAFMLLALTADWGQLYEGFFLSKYLRFEIVEFSILGILQLILIIYIFSKYLIEEATVEEVIKSGEHEKLEFKTSLRWDAQRNFVNKDLEKAVMKTIAAFLNSEGGQLVIGLDNKGAMVGIEADLISLPRPDVDGFENHFNNLFSSMIGPELRHLVRLNFKNINDKTICLVSIQPSHKPAYLKSGTGEDFYIRTGNATTPLKMSEVATYVSSWWGSK